jgi:polysaccharide biosynthesis protein PslH
MRILWVKAGGLWPLTAGGRIRSFHVVSEISRRHSVSVLTTHASPSEETELRSRLPGCEVLSFSHAPPKRNDPRFLISLARSWLSPLPVDLWRWRCSQLRETVTHLLASESYDLCVADFLSAMPNLPSKTDVPVMLFEHNVEHMIWRRLADNAARWQRSALELEWRKLRRFERHAVASASLTVAVSEADRDELVRLAPGARVRSMPTGVDTDYFRGNGVDPHEESIAFVGSMDWYPNEDAALHLIDSILPLIRIELPELTAALVGRNPSARLRAAAELAGVRVTGTVPDVRPFLEEAAVLVVPLRIGGGTRLKIFEGLAMGKAVVSTSVGAEGLPLSSGEHLVIADEPHRFAEAVLALLRDHGRRLRLGQTGRELVLDEYSWPRVARVFETLCSESVAVQPPSVQTQ